MRILVRRPIIPSTLALLTACQVAKTPVNLPADPLGGNHSASARLDSAPDYTISGRVEWPIGRKTQSTVGDVAFVATVSLIDANLNPNRTIATTTTNETGQFNLAFGGGFAPKTAQAYTLEAIKGLYNNVAHRAAVRLRTFIEFKQGGWQSAVANTITISTGTTTLAIIHSLRGQTATPAGNPTTFIGALTSSIPPATPSFTPGLTLVSTADYNTTYPQIAEAITADRDPVAILNLDPASGQYISTLTSSPAIYELVPNAGSIGGSILLKGELFDTANIANNIITFNGATASVLSNVTPGTIVAQVPVGATSGPVQLFNGAYGFSNKQTFTVIPTIPVSFVVP